MLKLRDVRNALVEYDMGITFGDGEYRVFPLRSYCASSEEDAAYYTNDLHDAFITGMMISRSYYAQIAA